MTWWPRYTYIRDRVAKTVIAHAKGNIMAKSTSAFSALVCGLAFSAIMPACLYGQTLPEAVTMALQTNPGLESQRAALTALGQRRVQANAQRRVQVSGETSVGYAGSWSRARGLTGAIGSSQFGDTVPSSIGVSASQPIWLAGRVEAALSQADAQIAQADARLTSAEIGVMRDVVFAYADLRRDLDGVRIRTQNTATLARQLEAARVRFEVGDITKTDVAQVEARFAGSKTALASAQARADASLSAIERLIGQMPTDVRPNFTLSQAPASLQQAQILARASNPDIVAARLGEAIAKAGARVIEAENRPRATLQATAGGALDQGFEGNRGGSVGVTARLSVPLFTAGVPASRISEALGNANAARLSAIDVERQVIERVSNAWRQAEVARQAVASTTEQVNAARIAYEGAELEQSVGLRTTLDVLIQQQELLEAELARAGADRDLQVAATALVAATGMLSPISFSTSRPIVPPVALPKPLFPEEPMILVQKALERTVPLASRIESGVSGVKLD
jgi:outer membrane protein